ncbi:MAG: efflux RND transporter periplasmic adaptor subunit [Pseudomonadota bacterium]
MLRGLMIALSILLPSFALAQDTLPKLAKIVTVTGNAPAQTRQFFGHVAAKETVDLAFQVAGQIVTIPIVEGEPVARGAVIATLDLEPFELALDQARVQRDQAERTLTRLQALEGNTVSQVSVDDAETQLKLAEIAVRNAERSLRDARLLSPFDALVASRNVANFTTIAAGTPVARLHDLSELRVEIDVPEVLFQQAGENPDVELVAKFPSSEERFPLEVREFNAETSQVGQTFQITLGMPPPAGLVVLPGSSVTVFATLKGGPSLLRIPSSAIIAGSDGSTQVMAFAPTGADEGAVTLTPVTITPGPRGEVLVEAGLEAGQEIVASGAALLSDGETVRRFTGFSN